MSQQGQSTPKMRRALTPRIKSAQLVEMESKNNLYLTEKRIEDRNVMNPQKVQRHLSKKLNLDLRVKSSANKADLANPNADTDSPARLNSFVQNKSKPKGEGRPLKKDLVGRNIQWPKNQRGHIDNIDSTQIQHKKGFKHQRCMSAHTFKSPNLPPTNQRSERIKQSKRQFDQKFNVAFDYLLRSNSMYLREKVSMCNQKARPTEKTFQIKRPSINTTHKDHFRPFQDKYRLDIQPQNQKMSILMGQSKVCGNSTSHEFHSGRKGKRQNKAEWAQGFKLNGPMFTVTTSQNAYPNNGDYQRMVPIAVFNEHPSGMKHKQTSSNSKFFKGQFCPRSNLATWNNLNPISNNFDPQRNTFYQRQFMKKEKQHIQTWPMAQHKLIITGGKYNTQVKTNLVDFTNHQLNYQNKCGCGRKRH